MNHDSDNVVIHFPMELETQVRDLIKEYHGELGPVQTTDNIAAAPNFPIINADDVVTAAAVATAIFQAGTAGAEFVEKLRRLLGDKGHVGKVTKHSKRDRRE